MLNIESAFLSALIIVGVFFDVSHTPELLLEKLYLVQYITYALDILYVTMSRLPAMQTTDVQYRFKCKVHYCKIKYISHIRLSEKKEFIITIVV